MPKTRAENALTRRRRRRWTVKEATKVLQAQAESGLPLCAFAAREGYNAHRLYRWRRRLGPSAPTPPSFEEVVQSEVGGEPSAPVSPVARERFEIVLGSGVVVRVAESFDAEALKRLLDVMDGRRPC
jgi:transposase-like protein